MIQGLFFATALSLTPSAIYTFDDSPDIVIDYDFPDGTTLIAWSKDGDPTKWQWFRGPTPDQRASDLEWLAQLSAFAPLPVLPVMILDEDDLGVKGVAIVYFGQEPDSSRLVGMRLINGRWTWTQARGGSR